MKSLPSKFYVSLLSACLLWASPLVPNISAAASASGTVHVNSNPTNASWPAGIAVSFWYNEAGQPTRPDDFNTPNVPAFEYRAIDAADEWSARSGVELTYRGTTADDCTSGDGKFVICWLDDSDFTSRFGTGSKEAIELAVSSDGKTITEADIYLKKNSDLIVNDVLRRFGFAIGLEANSFATSVMGPNDRIGSLSSEDISAVQALYPFPSVPTLPHTITRFPGFPGEVGIDEQLWSKDIIVSDSSGNAFVIGSVTDSIFKISPSGAVSLVQLGTGPDSVQQSDLVDIQAIVIDAADNLYAASESGAKIFKITPDFIPSIFHSGFVAHEMAIDTTGNLYLGNRVSNELIRVSQDGQSSEIAVKGVIDEISGMDFDQFGNLFVSGDESGNVVKISPAGNIEEILPSLKTRSADFDDHLGGLVVDNQNNVIFRRTLLDSVHKIAQDGSTNRVLSRRGDAAGNALNDPIALKVDRYGNLYVLGRNTLFRVQRDGKVFELLNGLSDYKNEEQTIILGGLSTDSIGNVYVVDTFSLEVLRISFDPQTNQLPTLSAFSGPVASTEQNLPVTLSFENLISLSDVSDSDGTIIGFEVDRLAPGSSLSIDGQPFTPGANNVIDATNAVVWTPPLDVSAERGTALDISGQPALYLRPIDNDQAVGQTDVLASIQVLPLNSPPPTAPIADPITLLNLDGDNSSYVLYGLPINLDIGMNAQLIATAAGNLDGSLLTFSVGSLSDSPAGLDTSSDILDFSDGVGAPFDASPGATFNAMGIIGRFSITEGDESMRILLNANATLDNVSFALRQLRFQNKSKSPSAEGKRAVNVKILGPLPAAGSAQAERPVRVHAVLEVNVTPAPPIDTSLRIDQLQGDHAEYVLNADAKALDAGANAQLFYDGGGHLGQGLLSISVNPIASSPAGLDTSADRLLFSGSLITVAGSAVGSSVSVDGVVIGSYEALEGDEKIRILLNPDATLTRLSQLLRALSFENKSGSSSAEGQRGVTVRIFGPPAASGGAQPVRPELEKTELVVNVNPAVTAPPPSTPSAGGGGGSVNPQQISGDIENTGVLSNITINAQASVNGGVLSGIIANSGSVSNVNLAPGTSIQGGVLSGIIKGDAESPGRIGSVVASGSSLENVILDKDALLNADIVVGSNVRFEDVEKIPVGLKLTGALNPKLWRTGGNVQVLDLEVSLEESSNSLLQRVKEIDAFSGAGVDISINPTDSSLMVSSNEQLITLLPVSVEQVDNSQPAGSQVNADGDVEVVTSTHQKITSFPLLGDQQTLETGLGNTLDLAFDNRANLVVTGFGDNLKVVARPDVVAVDASQGAEIGITQFPNNELKGINSVSVTFKDATGRLKTQAINPMPHDWLALKSLLAKIDGASDIQIAESGIISMKINGIAIRALADYFVSSGIPTAGTAVSASALGDLNGDGTIDYSLTFSTGEVQVLYILP